MSSLVRTLLRLPETLLGRERQLLKRPRWYAGITAALSLAGAWYCVGSVLGAKWGPVDDHELAEMLGSKRNFALGDYLSFVFRSDMFRPGQTGSRFRPSYWIFRATELFVWGAHPTIWYTARLIIFASFLAAVVWVLRNRLSIIENALFTAYLASSILWPDIFCRLGPGETYIVLGVACFAVGFQWCWMLAHDEQASPGRRWLASSLMFFGGFAAMGSKENMFFLSALCVPLVVRAGLRRRNRPIQIASLGSILFSMYVVIFTFVGVKRFGHVYSEDVTLGTRWTLLRGSLDSLMATWGWWVVGALLLALGAFVFSLDRPRPMKPFAKETMLAIAAVAGLALLFASQVAFYNGKWPILNLSQMCCGRYNFPGLLAIPFIVYVAYSWLVAASTTIGVPVWLIGWGRIVVLVWGALLVRDLTFPTRAAAQTTVTTTQAFTGKMQRFADAVRPAPAPVVFESFSVWDQEIMVSVAGFMRLYGADVPYFIKPYYSAAGFAPGSIERAIAETNEKAAVNGNWYQFRPWREFKGAPCYSVGFSGNPQLPCTVIGTAP